CGRGNIPALDASSCATSPVTRRSTWRGGSSPAFACREQPRAAPSGGVALAPAGSTRLRSTRAVMPDSLLAVSIGYLAGSIPFAFLVARARGIDVRRAGSGNVGATNVLRTSGVVTAVCVMLLDLAKGAGAVQCVARLAPGAVAAPAVAGLAAVV